jgi:hypothetical protein
MIAVAHNATRAILHHFRVLAFGSIIKTRIFENYANAISFYHSPMKKKGALPAGIPRASGERNSPTGNGASHNQVRPSTLFIVPLFSIYLSPFYCPPWQILLMSSGLDGETDQKFDSSRCCGLRKMQTPGRQSLLSIPPLPNRPTMQHNPTSSIILPAMKLATVPRLFPVFLIL